MKVLLPFLNGSLRAEEAIEKAGEKGDEIILLYVFPTGITPKISFQKLLFIALCGNYILNYAEAKLVGKKVKKIFRYGNELEEIRKVFEDENCGLLIIEGWHPRELEIVEKLDGPKITIMKRAEFPHAHLKCEKTKPVELIGFGKKPLDKILWQVYTGERKKEKKGTKPTPGYPIMPEDWENALSGGFSSIFLSVGLIYERELLENILPLGKTPLNENRFLNLSRRLYVLMKYKEPPKPKKDEWWADKDEFEKEIKPWCIQKLIKKMEETGYLTNEERFFVTSFLGHHFHLHSASILKLFQEKLIDYEPKIAAYNVYNVLGLLDSHPYVVSDRFARTNDLCLHCDNYYGYCALQRYYREWVSRQSARGVERLTSF